MNIFDGALIGMFIGVLLVGLSLADAEREVRRFNSSTINQALKRRMTFTPSYLKIFLVILAFTLGGAVVDLFI